MMSETARAAQAKQTKTMPDMGMEAPATTVAAGRPARRIMGPMLTEQDEQGWQPLARGKGLPGRLKVTATFAVPLDRETLRWATRKAETAGVDIISYLAGVLRDARARDKDAGPDA